MLGAPPAFVLSQDQTLYKWYLITYKVLNRCIHSARNRLRPCELLCLELFYVIFHHEKKVPYKLSILFNFQGPVRSALARDSLIIITQCKQLVKCFFELFFSSRPPSGGAPLPFCRPRVFIILTFRPLSTPFGQISGCFGLRLFFRRKSLYALPEKGNFRLCRPFSGLFCGGSSRSQNVSRRFVPSAESLNEHNILWFTA